jgi:hypothetical protein
MLTHWNHTVCNFLWLAVSLCKSLKGSSRLFSYQYPFLFLLLRSAVLLTMKKKFSNSSPTTWYSEDSNSYLKNKKRKIKKKIVSFPNKFESLWAKYGWLGFVIFTKDIWPQSPFFYSEFELFPECVLQNSEKSSDLKSEALGSLSPVPPVQTLSGFYHLCLSLAFSTLSILRLCWIKGDDV